MMQARCRVEDHVPCRQLQRYARRRGILQHQFAAVVLMRVGEEDPCRKIGSHAVSGAGYLALQVAGIVTFLQMIVN